MSAVSDVAGPDDVAEPDGVAEPGDAGETALEVHGLCKTFGATRALLPLDLRVGRGEVHALVGENGSGKSTFIKLLSGYHKPDAGEVLVGGHPLALGSATASHAAGCRFVHQDLGLIATETVLDNLYAGNGYPTSFGTVNGRVARKLAAEDLARAGVDLDPKRVVGTLSPAEQTGVAIARALRRSDGGGPQLLVLDEPTARLPDREVGVLLALVRSVTRAGVAVIYVSHRIDEVLEVAEFVSVLRDGRKVASRPVAGLDHASLVALLAGDGVEEADVSTHVPPPPDAPVLLSVDQLTSGRLNEVSFEVRQGEVVGVAGITGSGRETILSAIFGGEPREAGQVSVAGQAVQGGRPDHGVAAGLAYLPPDRRSAVVSGQTARENLVLARLRVHWRWPKISRRAERSETSTWFTRLNVRPVTGIEQPLSSFSGGNQQKILFGKWLRLDPKVLLLDEPTQGVDIATKAALHKEILAAADAGACAVVSSSDAGELIAVCHRILVMRDGRIAATLIGKDRTMANLTRASLGTGAASGSNGTAASNGNAA
ncbi:MAG TPA: sugar ABC transporter ATP-binding protein [Trebonia sp.]|nr:sugar ABC transporter ATP-binding protein [Trebonia sp.]